MYGLLNIRHSIFLFQLQAACFRSVWMCVSVCVQHSPPSTSHWRLWRWLSWRHFKCCWWTDRLYLPLFANGRLLCDDSPWAQSSCWVRRLLLVQSCSQCRSRHSPHCEMQQHRGRQSLTGEMTASVRRHDRRHSASDVLLKVLQRRRSSALEILSSSSHRVMVAVSVNLSQPPTERSRTRRCNHAELLFVHSGVS